MRGRRTGRWLALSGLVLALGCRTAGPQPTVVTTPLFPDAVLPVPTTPSLPAPGSVPEGKGNIPKSIPPALSAKPSTHLILPPGAQLPQEVPAPAPAMSPVLPPVETTSLAETSSRDHPTPLASPEIKPLLVPAPGPPPGPDGFAPAPILGPADETAPRLPLPMVKNLAEPTPLPLGPNERAGRAKDFSWLAGTLDYHARAGYWTLRYADIGQDDEWGGKVRLLDSEALKEFRPGDVIYVEGQLLAPSSAAREEATAYPPYRTTLMRRIAE